MPLNKETGANLSQSVYIYIYMCVWVCVCVFWHYFFVNTYFIQQYRQYLSTQFFIYLFESPHWFYGIRRELVNETPLINWFPSSFCSILGHHQGCVYCKSDKIFAYILLLCKCWTFIIYAGVLSVRSFLNLVL